MHRRRLFRVAVAGGLTVLAACADLSGPTRAARRPDPVDTTASIPTPIPRPRLTPIKVSWVDMAQRGATTQSPPGVRVLDYRGLPLGDVVVDFAIDLGGGSLASSQGLSDAYGYARAGSWKLGPTIGRNVVRATSPSSSDTVFVEVEAVDVDTLRVADRFVLDRIDGSVLPVVINDDFGVSQYVLLSAVMELLRGRFVFRWSWQASNTSTIVESVVAGTVTVNAFGPGLFFEMDGTDPAEYFRVSPAILLADGRLRIANWAEGWPLFGNFQDFKRAP